MRKIKILCMLVMLSFMASILSAYVTTGEDSESIKELNRLFEKSSTDQIMLALEPTIEKSEKEILDEIKEPVDSVIYKTYFLLITTSDSEKPDEKFQAFYGIPVCAYFPLIQRSAHIHHLGNITGHGSTSRSALIDMVKKLVEKRLIDPVRILEKLKR